MALWLLERVNEKSGRKELNKIKETPDVTKENRKHFLVISNEWTPFHGGISTFNQNLCISLAKRHKVSCYVGSATEDEIKVAKSNNVNLIPAKYLIGVPEKYRLLQIPEESGRKVSVDYIIGHDRHTGPIAIYLRDHIIDSKAVVFCHTAPRLIEWHKHDRNIKEHIGRLARSRSELQEEIFRQADLVVAVGPTLTKEANHLLRPEREGCTQTSVIPFVPGFSMRQKRSYSEPLCKVLFVGRAEDVNLKGIDIINKSVGYLKKKGLKMEWSLLGADENTEFSLKNTFKNLTNVIAYDPSRLKLSDELDRADILLMPSREEGFGLVAVEAIEHNRPFIISRTSGFAQHLDVIKNKFDDSFRNDMINYFVVDLEVEDEALALSNKIKSIIDNWSRVNECLSHLRSTLENYSWDEATDDLLQQIEI